MIDFGEEAPATAGLTNFYQNSAQNEAQEGEPEERKVPQAPAMLVMQKSSAQLLTSCSRIQCLLSESQI